jgi:hypothetical protein
MAHHIITHTPLAHIMMISSHASITSAKGEKSRDSSPNDENRRMPVTIQVISQ